MTARRWSRQRAALVLAMAIAAVPLVASVAEAAPRGAATEMRTACERTRDGLLRYVAGPGGCRSGERAVRFGRTRVLACAERGGFVYRVARRSACRRAPHRPSLALAIPGAAPATFCADRRTGALRSTQHAPYGGGGHPRRGTRTCKDEERRVFVQRANRRPRARPDAAATDATAAATVPVLANDRDPDGDRLRVADADAGTAAGTVSVAPGRDAVTYDPSGRFTALGAGASATETFSYRATDGRLRDRAVVTMTVRGVNDAPAAGADGAATDENTPVTIAVLANDGDPDTGDVVRVASLDKAGTLGAAAVQPDGTVGYDPRGRIDVAPGAQQADRFAYTVADGHGGTATATVTVTVRGTGAAPVVTTSAGAAAYTEGDPAVAADPGLALADADDTSLEGARVRILAGATAGDVLSFTDQLGITGAYDAGTGVLTLTGTAPLADYRTALRSVGFRNTGDTPGSVVRRVEFLVLDADAPGPPATRDVAVTPVDDPPVAVDDGASAVENDPAAAIDVLANDTDVDGGPRTIAAVTQPADGTAAITGGGTGLTYAPDAGTCGTDAFTYTLGGGSTATVTVTVACVDDAPDVDASAGALAFTEGDPATAIDTGVTVTDTDSTNLTGATVRITGGFAAGQDVLALPAQADISGSFSGDTLTLTGTATVAAYQAALRAVTYANASDAPSTAARTVTFQARDAGGFGTPGTHGVTVAAVDDGPVAVDDATTVAEDDAATAVTVLANDTDVDGGPRSIASVTQPADGTVVITGGGTGLTYTPDADFCTTPPGTTPDTFTYTLTPGGSTATVAVDVTCADDAPVAVDDAATIAEDASATAVAVLGNDTDVDGGPKGIAAVTQPADGTVVITGGGTGLTYAPDPDFCSSTPDTFTYTLNGGSTATVSITVTCDDDAPDAVDDAATVAEDAGATAVDVLGNDTDADAGPIAVASVTQPANGAVVNHGSDVGYTPDADFCTGPPGTTPDTFTYTLNGGDTAIVSMTVTCAPDAPVVDASGGALAYTENDPATPVDPGVTVTDADAGATIAGATVAITANFAAGQDLLALAGTHPGITPSFAGDTLTLSGAASLAAYRAALRDVTYRNSSEGPSALTRTVTFTVTDDTARTGSDTRAITVAGANDPPAAVDDTGTTDEDTTLNAAAPGVLANDTDVDPGDTKTVVALGGSGTLTGATAEGGSVTIGANGAYAYTPPAAFQALSTGQSGTDSFQYTMADGAGAQSTATVTLTVAGVSDAPVAAADAYDAIGNTGLFVGTSRPADQAGKVVTGSVLANDTDPDTPHASLVAVAETKPTTGGGTVVIEADGDFTFQPDDGDTTDSFGYTVSDGVASATGTVSIALAGQVWYVRNDEAAGGDGTSDTPFDTLAEAETASGGGDTVYVFDGTNTTANLDTGYVMEAGERLIGESADLQLDPDGGGPLPLSSLRPATPGARPTLTASNEDVVVLAAGARVDNVAVDPSGTGGGISGGAGTSGVTLAAIDIADTGTAGTQPGLELDGTTGTSTVAGLTVSTGGSATAIGVRLNNAGTVTFPAASTTTIATTGARALSLAGTALGTSQFDAVTVTGSGTGGVSLSGTTGTTTLDNLALTTTSGATGALVLANAGTVAVGGTSNLSATGGPAVDVSGTSVSALSFLTVSSAGSATTGINLDGLGTGTFSATGGTLAGAATIAFRLNGGSGNVTYPGTINDGTGSTASVTGRSGGVVRLSGSLNDGVGRRRRHRPVGQHGRVDGVLGRHEEARHGRPARDQRHGEHGPHRTSFSGGGLDLDTTSGAGLAATGGGTLR